MQMMSSEIIKGPWRPAQHFNELSATERNWLFDTSSLTKKLRQQFGRIELQLIHEGQRVASSSECLLMGIHLRSQVIERHVFLKDQHGVLVNAMSLLPLTSLTKANKRLRLQRPAPLGSLLFSLGCNRPQPMAYKSGDLWQRLSIFFLQSKPIMVIERFHPRVMLHAP